MKKTMKKIGKRMKWTEKKTMVKNWEKKNEKNWEKNNEKNWEKKNEKIGKKAMKKKILKMDSEERIHLKPMSEKEFREIAKGCGIKYRNKIPSRELKAMLGFRPLNNRMVEIRDEEGNCNLYDNMRRAAIENGLSN